VTETIAGRGFRLRRAGAEDIGFLVDLAAHPETEPFLAGISPWEEGEVREALRASAAEPDAHGRFVVEVPEGAGWRPAGGLGFAIQSRRSRVAYLFGVMIDPAHRGRGLAERSARLVALHLIRELGYHRVQLEVYGFNERALRLFERAGFVREGARRKAYWRHDDWHDGVMFGLVEEDL
jgi:RimJ/RimL family protein N-acetyltransferase